MGNAKEISKKVRIKFFQRRIWYVCPGCGLSLIFPKRRGISRCARCQQSLEWSSVDDMRFEIIHAEDSRDALEIAEGYFAATGMNEKDWIPLSNWVKDLKGKGGDLYLIFQNPKDYKVFKKNTRFRSVAS